MKARSTHGTGPKSAPAASREDRKAGASPARPLSPGRRWLFRLLALFVVPALVLGSIEGILRLAGYGYSTGLFKPMRIGGKDYLVDNEQFSLRFFPRELARTPGPIRMQPHKAPGTYRIFILGESAALGDPEPGFGAARYLEVLLRERYPEARFEIVNVAFTAINSHVIVPIARDCAAQGGDLWIVYMGNNEMVGPFGAATVFGPKAPPLALVRLSLAVRSTRLGQALSALAGHLRPHASTPPSWGGMQMFLGNQVAPDAPSRQTVYRSFERNLEDILRAGVKSGAHVLLSTVAVNLKDSPPFASRALTNLASADYTRGEQNLAQAATLEGRGQFTEANKCYENAAQVALMSADLQFRWGQCLLQGSNAAAALPHLQVACNLDTLPFRADGRINRIITETAQHWESRHPGSVVLFDAAAWLEQSAPQGILGQETFYEHVHFNFAGNYRLARGWAEQVARLLPQSLTGRAAPAWASQALCERRLGLTDWNRSIVLDGMARRLAQPPFSGQANARSRLAALKAWNEELHQHMTPAEAGAARDLFLEALQHAPEDYCVHENFATFLVANGDVAGAAAQWQRVHELIPQDYLADFRTGELLRLQGKLAEAEPLLQEAAALRPFICDPWFELSQLHVAQNQLEKALQELTRARQLRPGGAEYAYQMGRTLALLNRRDQAIAQFHEAVQLNPDYWQAHDALGGQLGLAGRIDEAKAEFETVTRLQPAYARAHLNLGVALLKEHQPAEAVSQFQEALHLEPTNTITQDYLRQAQSQAKQR